MDVVDWDQQHFGLKQQGAHNQHAPLPELLSCGHRIVRRNQRLTASQHLEHVTARLYKKCFENLLFGPTKKVFVNCLSVKVCEAGESRTTLTRKFASNPNELEGMEANAFGICFHIIHISYFDLCVIIHTVFNMCHLHYSHNPLFERIG